MNTTNGQVKKGIKFHHKYHSSKSLNFEILDVIYDTVHYQNIDTKGKYHIDLDSFNMYVSQGTWIIETPKEEVIEVGDTVEVLNGYEPRIGKQGTVTSIGQGINPIYTVDIEGDISVFRLNQIKLVSKAPKEMKYKFKVGDIIHKQVGKYDIHAEIKELYPRGGYMTNKGFMEEEGAELVDQGEIIGYELLKELPGIPQGATTHELGLNSTGWYFQQYFFNQEQIKDRNWFKPIYKPKSIRVNISDLEDGTHRIVEIVDGKLKLNDGIEFASIKQFQDLESMIKNLGALSVNTGRKKYPFKVKTFDIGCQPFTIKDVEDISRAINYSTNG